MSSISFELTANSQWDQSVTSHWKWVHTVSLPWECQLTVPSWTTGYNLSSQCISLFCQGIGASRCDKHDSQDKTAFIVYVCMHYKGLYCTIWCSAIVHYIGLYWNTWCSALVHYVRLYWRPTTSCCFLFAVFITDTTRNVSSSSKYWWKKWLFSRSAFWFKTISSVIPRHLKKEKIINILNIARYVLFV